MKIETQKNLFLDLDHCRCFWIFIVLFIIMLESGIIFNFRFKDIIKYKFV